MPVHRINVSPRIAAHTLTVRAQSGVPVDIDGPVFTSGATATPIAENSGAGQVVYTASATDDSLPVTYSLKPVGDHAAFAINGSTGAVTLTANPDYEGKASYAFTVIATDAVGNASERPVTLAITDVDEQAPTLVSAAVNGTSLVLTYSEPLATPGPAASAFSVSGATTAAQTPSSAVVSGATVTLTLATTAAYGQTITVSYAVPGANPIRDAAGNNAVALTAQAVTNSTASPAELFAGGETGVWYDPSDLSTLYQDAAGTVPVTAADQPVGKMLDKSGNGNHMTQSTSTARPVLQYDSGGRAYLAADGADDFMVSSFGVLVSETHTQIVAGRIDGPAGNYGGILSTRDGDGQAAVQVRSDGFVASVFWNDAPGATTIKTSIGLGQSFTISTQVQPGSQTVRQSGTVAGTSAVTPKAHTDRIAILSAAANGLFRMSGRFYGAVHVNRSMTAAELSRAERYLAYRSGVTIA